ncbi:MAG: hypothetical protein OEZ32_03765 [Nitrospinota bacterium]|nr:hypothetical protein [Nitrospinota bacterium]
MKKYVFGLASVIVLLSIIAFVPACGKSSRPRSFGNGAAPGVPGLPGSQNDTGNSSPDRGCGARHQMAGHQSVWGFSYCDKTATLHIDQKTTNASGEALGFRNVDRGMLTFRLTDMINGSITDRETFGIIFMADGRSNGEANWQWMSYAVGGGAIQSRLIVQRFDGSCPGFCENSYITDDLQFTNSSEVFEFNCGWDTTEGTVWCEITSKSDASFHMRADNDTLGPYNALRYIGLGRNAFEGPYPGYEGTVSHVQLTIFN